MRLEVKQNKEIYPKVIYHVHLFLLYLRKNIEDTKRILALTMIA